MDDNAESLENRGKDFILASIVFTTNYRQEIMGKTSFLCEQTTNY